MSALVPEPGDVKSFKSEAALETWMRRHHQRAPELWLRVYKKDSGVTTVTIAQALDVALCWGWIDGIRRAYDDLSFVQRFTPRRPRSMWSQVNQAHVARLTTAGRMTEFGQAQVDARPTADGMPPTRPSVPRHGRASRPTSAPRSRPARVPGRRSRTSTASTCSPWDFG